MFLVVSRLGEHFGFDHLTGRVSKIVRPNSRAPRKKFVHPCKSFFSEMYSEQSNI